jgi:hypothetical protein
MENFPFSTAQTGSGFKKASCEMATRDPFAVGKAARASSRSRALSNSEWWIGAELHLWSPIYVYIIQEVNVG